MLATAAMSMPLSEVRLREDEVLLEGFEAALDGHPVVVAAVLERTCVCEGPDGRRCLANKQRVMVDVEQLPIRRRSLG
jgi:hypothetical protein